MTPHSVNRVTRLAKHLGITLEELAQRSDRELLARRNFGPAALEYLRKHTRTYLPRVQFTIVLNTDLDTKRLSNSVVKAIESLDCKNVKISKLKRVS